MFPKQSFKNSLLSKYLVSQMSSNLRIERMYTDTFPASGVIKSDFAAKFGSLVEYFSQRNDFGVLVLISDACQLESLDLREMPVQSLSYGTEYCHGGMLFYFLVLRNSRFCNIFESKSAFQSNEKR